MARRGQNYLNNKDMLKQIHISKANYCWFEDRDKHHQYDVILNDTKEIRGSVEQARQNRADRMQKEAWDLNTDKKKRQSDFAVDPDSFDKGDLVFRVLTYDHIPDEPGRKQNPKSIADHKVKLNFPPFKHYVLEGRSIKEVGISHHNQKTKEFDIQSGKITATLANMYIKLVERYSQRSNWRGYTYIDEMRGQALLQLTQIGLQFNEAKSDNPFAYYTAAVNNSFTRVLNTEKKNQGIRDDLLEKSGQMPSWTRQLEHEMKSQERWQKVIKTRITDEDIPTETIKEIYADND
jgi:hypothetical protein|tara:strand:+ start:2434 stop:3309 length:876 start_codon:yes stop_codon:yes gene_type:complete